MTTSGILPTSLPQQGADMSVHTLPTSSAIDPIWQAKVHLAAALRLAVLDGLEEGIDNISPWWCLGEPTNTCCYLMACIGQK
ncbi:MAG: hypothetical protein ACKO69_08555, partial [Limnohabitans sp.]